MELNQTSICYYEKKLAHISAATESADSIVPDTFPDIGRPGDPDKDPGGE